MHLTRKTKKYIVVLMSVFFIIIIAFFYFSVLKNDFKKIIFQIFPSESIEELNLSSEQKVEDFESLYEIIITSFPNLEDVSKTFGIDFKNRKSKYEDLILNTNNDFEYYCTLTAILEDLASYHTGGCFPEYSSISAMNCYNLENLTATRELKPYIEYWNKIIKEYCEQYDDVKVAEFRYIDGEYIYDSKWSSEQYADLQGYKIVTIDDKDIDEYVIDNISIYKTQYDSLYNKPYKRVLTFNESIGNSVQVSLVNERDEFIEVKLCVSLEMEMVNTYYPNFSNENNTSPVENVTSHFDKERNVIYIQIRNFKSNEKNILKNHLMKIDENTKIIIDLRDNFGGNPNYAKNNVYPYLYNMDIDFYQNWFVPSSKTNDTEINKLLNKIVYGAEKLDGGVILNSTTHYKGGQSDYSDNIYYLVNKATASAADEYITMVKENNLGTIVGTNTAGEGLGGSFYVDMLKNSGFVFTYYPCQAYDKNEKNNALYGTEPDIYLPQSTESFYKQREMEKNGVNTETYDNRLIWDNILIEIVNTN